MFTKQYKSDFDLIKFHYEKELNSSKILKVNDEKKLMLAIEKGSKAAKDKMVKANFRLVFKIAEQHYGKGINVAELIQVGNSALRYALEKFDSEKEVRFSTYASWIIDFSLKNLFLEKSICLNSNRPRRLREIL